MLAQECHNTLNILVTTDHNLHENFAGNASRAKEVALTFWNSSIVRKLPPIISKCAPDQTITADHISMKILPEMYLGIRKSPLHFGSHP